MVSSSPPVVRDLATVTGSPHRTIMLNVYIFSLVFGAILIVASLVLGADNDGEVEADVSADVDGPDLALDDAGQQGFVTEHDGAHGSLAGFAGAFLSLRFWTYFPCFGGLAGASLTWLQLSAPAPTGVTAAVTGLVAGQGTVWLFRTLRAQETNEAHAAGDFVGKRARVLVSIAPDRPGKVRVTLGGTTVDQLARTEGDRELTEGAEVMIVGFDGATALVIDEARALAAADA